MPTIDIVRSSSADPGADDRGAVVVVRQLHDEVTFRVRLDSTVSLGELDAHAADRHRIEIDLVMSMIVLATLVRMVSVGRSVGVRRAHRRAGAGRLVVLAAVPTAAHEQAAATTQR